MNFPALSNLPNGIPVYLTVGGIYGFVCRGNPAMAAVAFAASEVFQTVLFAFANPLLGGDLASRSIKVNYACYFAASFALIFSLHAWKIIPQAGINLYIGIMVYKLIYPGKTTYRTQ